MEDKKIASLCSYIPIEIVEASGFGYERIIDDNEAIDTKIKGIFPTYMCSFASHCLNKLCNDFNKYEAIVFTNSCHPLESVYESIKRMHNEATVFMLNVPRGQSEEAIEYFSMELKRFIDFLEKKLSITISLDKIKDAVIKYNNRRNLFNKLHDLIRNKEIILSAKEIKQLNNYYMQNGNEYEKMIQEIIDSKDNRISDFSSPLILLSGNLCVPRDILDIIEEYDANVILCNTCDGFRSVASFIETEGDIIKNIAKAYLNKPACLRCKDMNLKLAQFEKYLDEYSINGAIFSVMKFCTDQTYWIVGVEKILKEKKIPFLFIDSDYSLESSGQIHTRIQAFLENL